VIKCLSKLLLSELHTHQTASTITITAKKLSYHTLCIPEPPCLQWQQATTPSSSRNIIPSHLRKMECCINIIKLTCVLTMHSVKGKGHCRKIYNVIINNKILSQLHFMTDVKHQLPIKHKFLLKTMAATLNNLQKCCSCAFKQEKHFKQQNDDSWSHKTVNTTLYYTTNVCSCN